MVWLIKRILGVCITPPKKDGHRLQCTALEDVPDCLLRSISHYLTLKEAALLSTINMRFKSILKSSLYHPDQLRRHNMDWYFKRHPGSDIRKFIKLEQDWMKFRKMTIC